MIEIDLIQRSIESSNCEYDDNLSDLYWSLIDLATTTPLRASDIDSYDRKRARFSHNEEYIKGILSRDWFPRIGGEGAIEGEELVLAFEAVLVQTDNLIGQQRSAVV